MPLIAATLSALFLAMPMPGQAGQAAPKRGGAFEIKVGDARQLADDPLRIRLDAVGEDSRCPADAQCVWAGDAAVQLTLERPPAAAETRILHTNQRLGYQTEYAGVVVRLVRLEPPRREGATIAPDEYRVTVVVDPGTKAGQERAGSAAAQAPTTPAAATVERGAIDGVPFYIEVPANWNKGLVMYAHGYTVVGTKPPDHASASTKAFHDVFLSRGFAFAASDYRRQGWAVKEAIEDTEALRRHFAAKYGQPSETYVTGHSMGGHITMAIIERHGDAYQGALPMCGPLGAAIDFLTTGPFDMLVTFEALFPGTIGSPYEPSLETGKKVAAAMAADPERAARYAQHYDRTVPQVVGALPLYHVIVGELKQRAGGEPFDNRNRIYFGFGDDLALNRTVKRYAANPAARDYVRLYATPTGRISDPILTIHTTSDNLVLGQDVSAYDVPAALAGTADKFVARFVEANGHCNFPPAQIATAFDALLAWARDGKRPEPGEQK